MYPLTNKLQRDLNTERKKHIVYIYICKKYIYIKDTNVSAQTHETLKDIFGIVLCNTRKKQEWY